MKVIFLDIDGVLNFWSSQAKTPTGMLGIVNEKVKLLKNIIDNTNARIVLTSSWRKFWDKGTDADEQTHPDGNYMMAKFRRQGVHLLEKLDDKYNTMKREEAIHEWLNDHEYVTEYVILDDEHWVYKDYSHCVFTDGEQGLTEDEVEAAIKILKGLDE